ncbi:hypothetical protein [Zophobihabitans entericus]|uniref:Uncharacterized protein n=1 Tax=Zophobihabitans entericus TaxID=1635327 RepID=A0A6G9IBE9_9GAMM|nr:hypothetical protein [Zophobihabitans entericus]QIQ21157.1 hypothetical protein IPMB12_05370 [Zophobihabitans entericus]
MQNILKPLAITSIALSLISILNGLVCLTFIVMNTFDLGPYWLYHGGQFFYIAEIIFVMALAVLTSLIVAIWVYQQSTK